MFPNDLFDQLDNSVFKIVSWESRVGIEKSDGARQGQVFKRLGAAYGFSVGQALIVRAKKGTDRHAQYVGNSRKAAGADAIGALFVFLHLLERNAQGLAEGALRHATGGPFDSNATANLDVNRVRCFLRHAIRTANRIGALGRCIEAGLALWVIPTR